jgi:hypothetical protein
VIRVQVEFGFVVSITNDERNGAVSNEKYTSGSHLDVAQTTATRECELFYRYDDDDEGRKTATTTTTDGAFHVPSLSIYRAYSYEQTYIAQGIIIISAKQAILL